MDAGINFSVAGSWEAPSEGHPNGRLVAQNGLVLSAVLRSTGIVDLSLLYPVNEGNLACVVTKRGSPADVFFSVVQTDNRVKSVECSFGGEQGFTNQSFDFIFVHMAQPVQGGTG